MDPAPEDPGDAVLVFRTVRASDLDAATEAVLACGVPCLPTWRPTPVPTGKHAVYGLMVYGDGELRVPRADVPRALVALRAHEQAAQHRIREHLRDLPRQLRFGALIGVPVVVAALLMDGARPGLPLGLGTAWALLALLEYRARARRRASAPPTAPAARPQPPTATPRPGWFDRGEKG